MKQKIQKLAPKWARDARKHLEGLPEDTARDLVKFPIAHFTEEIRGGWPGIKRMTRPCRSTRWCGRCFRRATRGVTSVTRRLTRDMLAIFTGARQGELLGLKWDDILWDTSQAWIHRTFTKGQFFATKTRGSDRKVDLGPVVVKKLKEWKLACPETKEGLVFPNEERKPLNYSNMMNRHYLPALKTAKIPKTRLHTLRHTCASLLLAQGESLKYVQTQLGHSSPTVTLNVYAHLLASSNPGAASRLENMVFGDHGSKMVGETEREVKSA